MSNKPKSKTVTLKSDKIEFQVNDKTPFLVYVTKSGRCTYSDLEQQGFPRLNTAMFLPGTTLSDKIVRWITENWTSNTPVMHWLAATASSWKVGDKVKCPVSSEAAKNVLTEILTYLSKNLETFEQISSLFAGAKTLAGTEVPQLSRAFDKMSYVERQAILKANQQRVEEVPQDPFNGFK